VVHLRAVRSFHRRPAAGFQLPNFRISPFQHFRISVLRPPPRFRSQSDPVTVAVWLQPTDPGHGGIRVASRRPICPPKLGRSRPSLQPQRGRNIPAQGNALGKPPRNHPKP
jgi:hypothetical protein